MNKIELKDDVITLRPYKVSDAAMVFAAVQESMIPLSRWMPWCRADYSIADSKHWLKLSTAAWQQGTAYEFAIIDTRDGCYIGGCGLNHLDNLNKIANLGYWVRRSRCKQGIATRAAKLLIQFGLNTLKFNRVEIVAAVENSASRGVAEKVGAVQEGILRHSMSLPDKVHDAILFSIVPADLKV